MKQVSVVAVVFVAVTGALTVVACGSSDDSGASASAGSGGQTSGSPGGGTATITGGTGNTTAGAPSGGAPSGGGNAAVASDAIAKGVPDAQDAAVTNDSIYWAGTNGGIYKLPLAGGTPVAIIPTSVVARSLTVTDNAVYYLASGESSATVNTAGLDGSAPKVLYTTVADDELGDGIVVTATNIYLLNKSVLAGGLVSIPLAGAAATTAVGAAPSGDFVDSIVASNATGAFFKAEDTSASATALIFTSFDGATTKVVGSVPLSGAGAGSLCDGLAADDAALYYIVQPVGDGPYPFFSAPISGAGATSLFTYSGSIGQAAVAPSKYLFVASDSGKAGIFQADASFAITEFATPPDQTSGSNGQHALRVTPDKSALVWFSGDPQFGNGVTVNKKSF